MNESQLREAIRHELKSIHENDEIARQISAGITGSFGLSDNELQVVMAVLSLLSIKPSLKLINRVANKIKSYKNSNKNQERIQ